MNIDLSFQKFVQHLSFLQMIYKEMPHSPTSKSLAGFQSHVYPDKAHVVSMLSFCCG